MWSIKCTAADTMPILPGCQLVQADWARQMHCTNRIPGEDLICCAQVTWPGMLYITDRHSCFKAQRDSTTLMLPHTDVGLVEKAEKGVEVWASARCCLHVHCVLPCNCFCCAPVISEKLHASCCDCEQRALSHPSVTDSSSFVCGKLFTATDHQ